MAEAAVKPPEGFIAESDVPPPPSGFEIVKSPTDTPEATAKPSWASRILRAPFEQLEPPFMRESETGKTIADVGAKSVLPMAGMAAGSFLGPLGEAGGSFAGTGLNQILGIEEPSKTQLGLSLVAPKAGEYLGKAGQAGLKWLGKSVAGRDIMHAAAQRLLQKMMAPEISSELLRKEIDELNFFLPGIRTSEALQKTLTEEMRRAPTSIKQKIVDTVEPIRDWFVPARGEIPSIHASDLFKEEKRLEEIAKKAFKDGENEFAFAVQGIRGAMLDDAERSGAEVIKEFTAAYRKEKALDAVVEQLGKPHPEIKISAWLKKDPLHAKAFSAPEIAQIDRIAEKLAHVSASGGSGEFGQAIRAGTGYAAGGWWGMLAGLAGPGAIRKILGTQFGRNFTERILSGERGRVTPEVVKALAIFARGMSARPPEEAQAAEPAPESAAAEY